jgi:glycyl-tRNA synthetase beta chain
MNDFLWEIGCEEIPARMQKNAQDALERLVRQHSQSLTFQSIQTYSSPRRLAVRLQSVCPILAKPEIKQGPLIDLGEKALAGFCRTWGVDRQSCTPVITPKGAIWSTIILPKETSINTLLMAMCTQVLHDMFWPKRMRWTDAPSWIRPIRWMVALYGNRTLDWSWNGIVAGSWSEAHRLAPHSDFFDTPADLLHQNSPDSRFGMTITSPQTYAVQLAHSGVIIDRQARKERIRNDVAALAAKKGGLGYADTFEMLVEENAGLVQWPQAIVCAFDPKFLILPLEVIVTTLQVHQKCFCIQSLKDQSLLPYFVMIADGPLPSACIQEGYERVVSARLTDALFFWNQDLKIPLAERIPDLEKRSFFQDLGTLHHKVQRLECLMQWIANHTNHGQWAGLAQQVALLCKCDLLTAMVSEFPLLQGTMGRYYGENQGLDPQVARALQEAYDYPRLNHGALRAFGLLGAWLAIADGLDTLVGFFALGRIPSGSKDPMALRRACQGTIRAMVAQNISIDLTEMMDFALEGYHQQGFLLARSGCGGMDRLMPFFYDRMTHLLKESGVLTDASIAKTLLTGSNMLEIWKNGEKIAMLLAEHPDFLASHRRAHALVQQMQAQHSTDDFTALIHPLEQTLIGLLKQPCAVENLPQWTKALNDFLDCIKVQEEPYTSARLGLLNGILLHLTSVGPIDKVYLD